MGNEKISDTKVRAIMRMRELGFTVARISSILDISRVTVYDHINPVSYKNRLRRVTTSNREKHPTVARRPKRCELCKIGERKLSFHVLTKEKLLIGLWLCSSCNTFGDICDDIGTPGLLKKAILYFDLVDHLMPGENESKISENKVSKEISKQSG